MSSGIVAAQLSSMLDLHFKRVLALLFTLSIFAGADELPAIAINQNHSPAGELKDGVLSLQLEIGKGEWRPEANNGRDPGWEQTDPCAFVGRRRPSADVRFQLEEEGGYTGAQVSYMGQRPRAGRRHHRAGSCSYRERSADQG